MVRTSVHSDLFVWTVLNIGKSFSLGILGADSLPEWLQQPALQAGPKPGASSESSTRLQWHKLWLSSIAFPRSLAGRWVRVGITGP